MWSSGTWINDEVHLDLWIDMCTRDPAAIPPRSSGFGGGSVLDFGPARSSKWFASWSIGVWSTLDDEEMMEIRITSQR